tara:strand:+ start:540 stop:749 length:210 start_codon:yes stop_codon:yes gene_type:complete
MNKIIFKWVGEWGSEDINLVSNNELDLIEYLEKNHGHRYDFKIIDDTVAIVPEVGATEYVKIIWAIQTF